MAKKSQPAPATPEGTPAVAGLVEAPPAPAAPKRYRVSLNCPTPLLDRAKEFEAADEGEARRLFDAHNGICGSVHPYSVVEV